MPETPEAVIAFGPDQDDDEAAAPRRRFSVGAFLAGFAGDRRLVPVAAGIGAIALFASLISEWQITTVDRAVFVGGAGDRLIPTEVTDLGARAWVLPEPDIQPPTVFPMR